MKKQKFDDYYVGLDIGTNSVGWAVTNKNYKVLKFNKKSMWGIRMFDAANTAEERRVFRTNRRRLTRRKYRLKLLENIFEDELTKIDASFLVNLSEGSLHKEDKSTNNKYTLFNDEDYTDDNYHQKYPTIYHLRNDLIINPKKHDIREVYLAIHHIMKYRGHFLFDGELKSDNNIDEAFQLLNDSTMNLYGNRIFELNQENLEGLKLILKDSNLTVRDRNNKIKKLLNPEIDKDTKKIFNKIASLIGGSKLSNIIDIFPDLEIEEKLAIDFKSNSIDEDLDALSALDFDQMQLIEHSKAIYDWGLLEEIRDGQKYISVAKIKSYEQHAEELAELKNMVKRGASTEIYNDFFHNKNNKANYAAYIGNGETKTATTDDFYKAVKKLLNSIKGFEIEKTNILSKIETNHYLPKQRVGSNGVIPHQLHLLELESIIENAKEYLPFLSEMDESGLSNAEKIVEIFKFRIPYYVGPLNPYHKEENERQGTAWVIRKKEGKVLPWNFEDMIDVTASAEKFITRMTNQCSYLLSEDVLPKHSMLYQKYMVLNEINNLKLDGQDISIKLKQHMFEDLFVKQYRNITKKQITKWLMDNNYISRDEKIVITGIDDQIKSKLTTLHDMKQIFGDKLPDTETLDTIVYWITLFSDSKDILEDKIKESYGDTISEQEIKRIRNKNYGGWGRFSRKLLEGIGDNNFFTEPTSIIQALYSTNYNFMELLTNQFEYSKKIEQFNQKEIHIPEKLDYSIVDEYSLSPSVKRPVWQSLRIMDELVSITKKAPKKIFVEMARGGGQAGRRTQSRKNQLIELYKNIKEDSDLLGQLENTDEARLRSKKLYLYYTQRGRCMYSGETISISQLYDENIYDLDHIYPRSVTKDDSMNNMVLVKKSLNQRKGNTYPIEDALRIPCQVYALWGSLHEQGLISNRKYERLIRKEPLTDAEKADFIARQLVETRQSTKAIANIFKQLYPETQIVFVKAGLVSDFRNEQKNVDKETGELKNPEYKHFIKLRMINDLHHAKDAYLNIVVGNVYHTKFTSNPLNYIKKTNNRSYNLGRMYDSKVERSNQIAWIPGLDGTIKRVNRMMKRHDILTTWMITDGKGGLFDQTIMPKGKGQVPIKKGRDIEKYGGYNKASVAYYVVAEHNRGKNSIRTIESIPVYIIDQIKTDEDLTKYLVEEMKLNNPIIVNNHIPARNALFEYDGIKGRITGKSGQQYLVRNEIQLVLPDEYNSTLKEIEKYLNPHNSLSIDKLGINSELLVDIFNELTLKADSQLYKEKLKNFSDILNNSSEKLSEMSNEEIVTVLTEIIKLFKATRETSNLKLIGGSGKSGTLYLGRNISNKNSFYLINQSITGLFENRVDLLK